MGMYSPRAVTEEEYIKIIETIRNGFTDKQGVKHRPNEPVAFALILEANLGVRIIDVLHLCQNDIIWNGDSWQLDIIEQKTGKKRICIIPQELKAYIDNYCTRYNIHPARRIIQLSSRNIQKLVKLTCESLELTNISTHSFRRFAGLNVYAASGYDIVTVQQFYQHSSTGVTMNYLRRSSKQMDEAIKGAMRLL